MKNIVFTALIQVSITVMIRNFIKNSKNIFITYKKDDLLKRMGMDT